MKTQFTFIFLTLFLNVYSQEKSSSKVMYACKMDLIQNSETIKGEIYSVLDSEIVFRQRMTAKSVEDSGKYQLMTVPAEKIIQLKIRRHGAVGRGLVKGMLIGMATGAIIGFASGDDPKTGGFQIFRMTATEKALAGSIVGAFPGALIGGLCGTASIIIPINSSKEKFNVQKSTIKSFSITK